MATRPPEADPSMPIDIPVPSPVDPQVPSPADPTAPDVSPGQPPLPGNHPDPDGR